MEIPNSVTSIGDNAFTGCASLTSVEIPKSVTSIGMEAFYCCASLTSVHVSDIAAWCKIDFSDSCSNPLNYAHNIYLNGELVTNMVIRNSVTEIGKYAFRYCTCLKSVEIPSSVTKIGEYALYGCSSLMSFTGKFASEDHRCLIVDGVLNYFAPAGLTTYKIPSSVNKIGDEAFRGCSGLTSVEIPNSVATIGRYAFYDCANLLIVCKNERPTSANYRSFGEGCMAIVPESTVDAYKAATGWKEIPINETFRVAKTTQTTITLVAGRALSNPSVTLAGKVYNPTNDTVKITGLVPNKSYTFETYGKYEDIEFNSDLTATTQTVSVSIRLVSATNTTLRANGSYSAGDAQVTNAGFDGEGGGSEIVIKGLQPGEEKFLKFSVVTNDGSCFTAYETIQTKAVTADCTAKVGATTCVLSGTLSGIIDVTPVKNGYEENNYESSDLVLHGLNPNTTYTKTYLVTFAEGGSVEKSVTFTTSDITLTTLQPKVVSEGNIIVAAESNLDDEETNVGFEWRRTDWSSDFDSKKGEAYLYNGTIEGYIKGLNSKYLWKFRPYYEANDGMCYYGEWKGMDPSDFSYFEPTVHTYAQITVEGNSAKVKGYVMRGTDNVASQGFMYWKTTSGSASSMRKVPATAQVVTATGNVMGASLTGLEYETEYHYVAFVTTSEGDTFYGEELSFTTGADATGIGDVEAKTAPIEILGYYNLEGRKLEHPGRGINIVRYSNGTTRKVLVK